MRRSLGVVSIAIAVAFVGLVLLLPDRGTKFLSVAVAGVAAVSYLWAIRWEMRRRAEAGLRRPKSVYSLILFWVLFLTVPLTYALVILLAAPWSLASFFFLISLLGLTFTLFYDFINLPLALYHKRLEERRLAQPLSRHPPMSVIVPAHNEEKVLGRTLEVLLDLDYPDYEILVVDDGSTDTTYRVARRFADRGVRVLRRPNGGKSSALNLGLFFAKGEIIVIVDADSLVARDSLKEMAKLFTDREIMAVCGNVKVLNRVSLLTRLQALEYIVDINIAKRAFDVFGSTMVVPGPLGAFRRSALDAVGRYDPDTLTEDFDTTLKVLKTGNVIQSTNFAEAYTEAPETLRDLYRQRHRWYAGTLQTLVKHGDVVRNPRFGFLTGVGYPYLLVSMILVPIMGLLALAAGILAALSGMLVEFLLIVGMFVVLETLIALLALLMDGEDLKLLAFAPLFVIGYRQIRDFFRLEAMVQVLLRRKVGWTRAERVGRAQELTPR